MWKILKATILIYIHHRGWCKKLHVDEKTREKRSDDLECWKTNSKCPLINIAMDSIMLTIFEPIIITGKNKLEIHEN